MYHGVYCSRVQMSARTRVISVSAEVFRKTKNPLKMSYNMDIPTAGADKKAYRHTHMERPVKDSALRAPHTAHHKPACLIITHVCVHDSAERSITRGD